MIEVCRNGHRANFGYVLARPYWGNGFMPEAIAAIVKITLEPPTIYRMEATCDEEVWNMCMLTCRPQERERIDARSSAP
jgi:hypothetical protein